MTTWKIKLGLGVAAWALTACDVDDASNQSGTLSEGGSGINIPARDGDDSMADDSAGDDSMADDSSGDDSSGDDVGPSCGAETLSFELAPPNVVLVLDKSGSMVSNRWDHDLEATTPEVTRWSSLHHVVQNVVEDFDHRLRLGAVLFPAVDVDNTGGLSACRVRDTPDALVAASNGAQVLASMPAADSTEIFGGTPATAGLELAMSHLLDRDTENPNAIILVTDGAANCSAGAEGGAVFSGYDEALAPTAAEAYALGIPVYVVGIDIEDTLLSTPVANPWERLSEVADAGGVPKTPEVPFYDVFDEQELDAAIEQIANEVSCTITLPDAVADTSRLELSLDGVSIPRVDTCEADEGWIEDGPGQARLCSQTCTAAQSESLLDARLSCIPEG